MSKQATPDIPVQADGDAIYYRDAANLIGVRNVSARARKAVYDLFVREMRPTASTTVLDLGVSGEEGPEANMLERQYPWPENIVCAGLGDGEQLRRHHPRVAYVKIEAGRQLPFDGKTFDVVWSNAVLEHVGGRENRASFLAEATRVANSIFIAVPNRWFPVEHHTGIPFLHWNAALFRAALRTTRWDYWSHQENLDFLSKHRLRSEVREIEQPSLIYSGIRLGLFSSNLALVAKNLQARSG